MRIRGLAWLGVPTDRYEEMRQFLVGGLDLHVAFQEDASVEVTFDGGSRLQLFGPGSGYYSFCRELNVPLVPLFEVDDLDAARLVLMDAGAEVVSDNESDEDWTWLHARAPDGNLYSFAQRRHR